MPAARKRRHHTPPAADRCVARTASGKRCKHRRLDDGTVCAQHAARGRARGGAPSKLTPELTERVTGILSVGGYVEAAAGAAGIARYTLDRWLERGDPEGTAAEDEPYRVFRAAVEKAVAEGEQHAVGTIKRAAENGDWRAAAFMLERQHPERWAPPRSASRRPPRSVVDPMAGTVAEQPAGLRLVDDQVAADGRPL